MQCFLTPSCSNKFVSVYWGEFSVCVCVCVGVLMPSPPIPSFSNPPLHWDAGRLSLIPGELIRISGEERVPDRVRTNCTAELHSDAFRSVFMSVWFGCMSVDLSGWQMRDWPAQALDNHVEHPHAHTCTDKHTYRHIRSPCTHTRWYFKYPLH